MGLSLLGPGIAERWRGVCQPSPSPLPCHPPPNPAPFLQLLDCKKKMQELDKADRMYLAGDVAMFDNVVDGANVMTIE